MLSFGPFVPLAVQRPSPCGRRPIVQNKANSRGSFKFEVEFCKMGIGPIFFQEISFFDFLEESAQVIVW
jgi:hypothetical protein